MYGLPLTAVQTVPKILSEVAIVNLRLYRLCIDMGGPRLSKNNLSKRILMGGGIFPERPFALNREPKVPCIQWCIGFRVLDITMAMGQYDVNKWHATFLIASSGYIGLAWYDHKYDCKDKMSAGALSTIYGPLKPPVRYGKYT